MQNLVQHFWRRWSAEYISELQVRSKWRTKEEDMIKIRSFVIVKEDNLAPLQWKLGRVIEVQKGSDNVARVATIQTSLGTYKRAVARLCLLPIEENQ